MKYLLDTNICIYYMKGKYNLDQKFEQRNTSQFFISEITLAELKFGIANSMRLSENEKVLDDFLSGVQVLPLTHVLDIYATEKARLRKIGKPVDEFDLLIGATTIAYDMILITNNEKHFENLDQIKIENWTIQT